MDCGRCDSKIGYFVTLPRTLSMEYWNQFANPLDGKYIYLVDDGLWSFVDVWFSID